MHRWMTAAALATLAACGGGGESGGGTPQDVFDTAKQAGSARDFKAFFACVDPDSRDTMLMAMSIGVAFAAMGEKGAETDMEALQKKHGVKTAKGAPTGGADSMRAAAKEAFADVKDKAALFADLAALMEKYSKDKKNPISSLGTLKDVVISGDTAKAKEVREGGEKDIAFVRRDQRWYLALE